MARHRLISNRSTATLEKPTDYSTLSLRDRMAQQMLPTGRQRVRCLTCNRPKATCFCGFVKPFETSTRFVILMHPKEYKFQSLGTGRMTGTALRNSEIIVGSEFSANQRVLSLLADTSFYPVLLYPKADAVNLSGNDEFIVPEGKTLLVFVIDGTWATAKKIILLSANLRALPKIRFIPPAPSRFHIKRQPAAQCVSTIEAVHYLLELLQTRGFENLKDGHKTLLEGIDSLIEFQKKFVEIHPKKPLRS
ncbi:MAG: DTW domain-containing protein [Fibrobacteres bacterium]|nr:DTW domain-containing protein [Fibrobacterota bacterium]